jgi:nucleotide-binding universal stress UspA family protein
MLYPALLVHLGLGPPNEVRLATARQLAERFDATVIGAAACDPQPPPSYDGLYPPDVLIADRGYAEERLAAAEAEFRAAFRSRETRIEWRSAFAAPAGFVAAESRSADLVITGSIKPDLLSDPNWRLDPGDLVMRAGRPLLVTPEEDHPLVLDTLIVGWKDNRESRRAVADALPLARLAARILVVAVAEERGQDGRSAGTADVVAWLRRHGLTAEERTLPLVSGPASQLRTLALDEGAGVIVAGAYGHSRTREWILGGVTHDFLTRPTSAHLLLSH